MIKDSFPARIIVDDHYEHGLRLFQERDTGVIRLQASVQSGELKGQVFIRSCQPQINHSCADLGEKETDLDGFHHPSDPLAYLDVKR